MEDEFTPDKSVQKFFEWFDVKSRIAFLVTFIMAFFVNMSIYTTRITHGDDIWNIFPRENTSREKELGRWFLSFIVELKARLSLTNVNFILALFFIALTVVIIVKLFKLKSYTNIVLISMIFACFPKISDVLTFLYCSAEYMFAMFLAVLTVYICYKNKKKRWISIICLFLSLSIYQLYIQFTISIFLILIILELMRCEISVKEILSRGLIYSKIGIVTAFCYLISIKISGVVLDTYKNMNNMANLNLPPIHTSILSMYKEFLKFFVYNINLEIIRYVYIIISILLLINYIVILRNCRNKIRAIIGWGLSSLMPVGFFTFLLFTPRTSMSAIMYPQMIIMVIYLIILNEMVDEKKYFFLRWGTVISETVLIIIYIFVSNSMYLHMQLNFDRMYSLATRVVYTVEQYEENIQNMPVIIYGDSNPNHNERLDDLVKNSAAYHWVEWKGDGIYCNTKTWLYFIKYYLGVDWNSCEEAKAEKIIQTNEFKNMKAFPNKDCIKIIDDVVAVKISD